MLVKKHFLDKNYHSKNLGKKPDWIQFCVIWRSDKWWMKGNQRETNKSVSSSFFRGQSPKLWLDFLNLKILTQSQSRRPVLGNLYTSNYWWGAATLKIGGREEAFWCLLEDEFSPLVCRSGWYIKTLFYTSLFCFMVLGCQLWPFSILWLTPCSFILAQTYYAGRPN